MEHRIILLNERKIIGMKMKMSYRNNLTFRLWSSFMPQRSKILNKKSNDLFSIQVYGENFNFQKLDPDKEFEKIAGVEVENFNTIPEGMTAFILEEGLYAVFRHKGAVSEAEKIFGYIFGTWLPQSGYVIDSRPHFEILGENYRHDDPDSTEDIWIPVK
jgi:AraC family transcriptional regulator